VGTYIQLKLKFRENDIIYRYWAEVKEFRAKVFLDGVPGDLSTRSALLEVHRHSLLSASASDNPYALLVVGK